MFVPWLRVFGCLLVLGTGCGRIGLDLLADGDDGPRGGTGARDGGTRDGDVCVLGVCASDVDRCASNSAKASPGICGCATSDGDDEDDDGTPDCIDFCPDAPDVLEDGECGCAAAAEDDDRDGAANCHDQCPDDADKTSPEVCGCGIADTDGDDDGMADCADACDDDAQKVEPGLCGCGTDESANDSDSDDDGENDCVDTCGGADDTRYVPDASCGVGYCRSTNTPSSCTDGAETACVPGEPAGSDDAICDGVDDDCDGSTDENYAADASCGLGYCADNNTASSCVDGTETACQPAAPLDVVDETADGVDDDCDGSLDEDVCVPASETFSTAGEHALAAPVGCHTVTVQLWGGGGASGGGGGYWGNATGGRGGPGGFSERTFTLSATAVMNLRIGEGSQDCGMAGGNVNASYSGGDGATNRSDNGGAGADGTEAGGDGGMSSGAGDGGRGYFGGGGGGAGGGPTWNPFGTAGGGGAASVLFVDALRLVAGGGGGGGGSGSTLVSSGTSGGDGGSGCSAVGTSAGNDGGGGGGGGMCDGTNNQPGTGGDPFVPAGVTLPAGTAAGGVTSSDCQPGGNGYAIVSWAP